MARMVYRGSPVLTGLYCDSDIRGQRAIRLAPTKIQFGCTILMLTALARRAKYVPRPVLMSHQLTVEVRCLFLSPYSTSSSCPKKLRIRSISFFGIDSMEELRSRQRITRKKRS